MTSAVSGCKKRHVTAQLSVNVNKVATLRNSRGGDVPDLRQAVRTIIESGAHGITVHPRADERHITLADTRELGAMLAPQREQIEYNIEGDPRLDLMELVCELAPHQCTLVPVRPGEITSEAGWDVSAPSDDLRGVVKRLQDKEIRVSLFVDPKPGAVQWAASLGADRIELYTEPFARAFAQGAATAQESFASYGVAAKTARQLGLGVNAGHDLDLDNLALFRRLPYLDEVSIGHALICRALYVGLSSVVEEYVALLNS